VTHAGSRGCGEYRTAVGIGDVMAGRTFPEDLLAWAGSGASMLTAKFSISW
jgi:hypothetical protein